MRRTVGAVVTLRHVQTLHKGGKVYRYMRVPGKPRVRLPDLDPSDPSFIAAYLAALGDDAPKPRAPVGSIAAMIEAFITSDRFLRLSASYRRVIRRHADAIRDIAQDAKAAHLRADHIRKDIASLPPHVAKQRLKAWRLVCSFGAETMLIPSDPSETVKAKAAPKTEGHQPWTRDEIEAFRAHWPIGTVQRRAFELLFWTGARISDAVRLGPGMIDRDGVLTYRQAKTGDPAHVPWSCPLPAYATAMEADRQIMHEALSGPLAMTFLATAQGRARSHKALGGVIGEAARKIGIEKSAHGLRKARAVALAEAGATAHGIGAWTGHRTLAEVQHYTDAADRKRAVMGTDQGREIVNRPIQAV